MPATCSVNSSLACTQRLPSASEQRFFALTNQEIAGLAETDRSGRFTFVNDYFCGLTGYSHEELMQLRIQDITCQDDLPKTLASLDKVITGGLRTTLENRYVRPDGDRIWVANAMNALMDVNGETSNVLSLVVDITQGKNEEEQRRKNHTILADISERQAMLQEISQLNFNLESKVEERTAELKAANKAKSIFLANMSHEIRTPLNAIVGLTELLRHEISTPKHKRKLDQLLESSEHLLAIINDILDISKIEAGQLTIDKTEFGLGSVIDRIFRLLQGQAREKGLTLSTEISPVLRDLQLEGDPLRLSQVLINLCNNAIKFTDKGKVTLSVICTVENESNFLIRFTVSDTGCGIDFADQAQLFQPFMQLDASPTRRHGGTGLGLAISQHMVKLMGSEIQVSSVIGIGSTFSFEVRMPRATHGVQDSICTQPDPESFDFGGKRVLVAEDHPLSQEILLEMLESLGCDADVAFDGKQAVDCAQSSQYDLLLMDMQMPRMDGLSATRNIRKLPGYQKTPIIALTANAFAEDRQRCLKAGMNGHFGKPVTLSRLASLLSQWMPDVAVNIINQEISCDDELCRALMSIPGIEIDSSWRTSTERLLSYRDLLKRFIETNTQDIKQMFADLENGEHQKACNLAHNLKGIAALIGAKEIARIASKLEELLKKGEERPQISQLMKQSEEALSRLSETIRSIPQPGNNRSNHEHECRSGTR